MSRSEKLRMHLADADRHRPGTPVRLTALRAARRLTDELVQVDRPLSADVAADAHIAVPARLADEAAVAVGVLWRISQARAVLGDFHQQFVDRYGPDRFVPLMEVTDPVLGLGDIDAGTASAPLSSDRAVTLACLMDQAIQRGHIEVVLDAATIDALDTHPVELPPPPTAEVYARVLAPSPDAHATGQLFLAIYDGGTQQAGSTLGRFTALLPQAGVASTSPEHLLTAELAVRPRSPELAGVAPPSGLATRRIPIGLTPQNGDLALTDLLLASDGRRFVLWSAHHGRQVVPVFYSRIGSRYVPPVARLLEQLGAQGCRAWHGWSWEPLHHCPFQPRVRYKRTILAPARWLLPADLIDAAGNRRRWQQVLESWRRMTSPRPPDIIVVDDPERQLPLDLGQQTDRELLRRYVRRGLTGVTEQPGGPDAVQAVVSGLRGHHVLELVIPLARRSSSITAPPAAPVRARPTGDGLHLPGSRWLSLAIPAPSHCYEEILSGLSHLIAGMPEQIVKWFWLRYANAAHGPHLRVRFQGHPSGARRRAAARAVHMV